MSGPDHRCVLFDFDGTLVDSARCGVLATRWAFEDAGLPAPDADRIVATMGIPIEQAFPILSDRPLSGAALATLIQRFRGRYAELAETHIVAFPGIPEMLAAVRTAGLATAIVTSKRTVVAQQNAAHVGIADLVDAIVGSDLVERPKPDPDGVHVALGQLGLDGIDPAQVLVVGDATYDIQMGKAAGTRTCAVTWGAHLEPELAACDPDLIVHDPRTLTEVCTG